MSMTEDKKQVVSQIGFFSSDPQHMLKTHKSESHGNPGDVSNVADQDKTDLLIVSDHKILTRKISAYSQRKSHQSKQQVESGTRSI